MKYLVVLVILFIQGCVMTTTKQSSEQLLRSSYQSQIANEERDYFVYLPKGYHSQSDKKWPVMLFLHGNGERGNGKNELDYVITHGPLYEAWIQKKDLPFIIISPQLHMFDMDKKGLSYIDDRTISQIPKRLKNGVPARPVSFGQDKEIIRHNSVKDMSLVDPLLPQGWEAVEEDLLNILQSVQSNYRVTPNKTYLTGLSYGGFGTWYMASKHPEKFAAIAPVVGWGHPSLMSPIAKQQLPVWQFAGGLDGAVEIQYFYAGISELKKFGHKNLRFTVHEDMAHDTWTRVYASDDLYQWFLSHSM